MNNNIIKKLQINKGRIAASKKYVEKDCNTHWHDFYEIEYVLDGIGTCYINNCAYEMKKGSLFFLTPADFHSVKTSGVTIINIMFSSNLVNSSYLSPYTKDDVLKSITVSPQMQEFIETIFLQIVQSKEDTRFCATLIDAILLKLSYCFACENNVNTHTISQKMRFYIINNFREKITLDDVAKSAGVTPAYASTILKKETNTGFKKYLNTLRFEYAKKLLIHSDYTVQQICLESGFEDYPNFVRRFKINFGESPMQFRKSNQEHNLTNQHLM